MNKSAQGTSAVEPVEAGSTLPPPSPPGWRLRFWLVFGGQGLSQMGSALTQFVLLWWITDTTGSLSALATAGMAALLPQALLAPLGGTIADRYSRRVIMVVADVVSAACMAVLIAIFLSGDVTLSHVYTMMAIRSAMQAFQSPASTASVPMLVPRSFLTRASGLNQALQSMTLVAAAPLGALALSVMPIGWALAIDVITALAGVVPLLFIDIPQPESKTARRSGLLAGIWAEFNEGVQLVWRSPGLRHLYLLLACVVLVIMPSFTLVPLLVKEHFGGGAQQVALIEGASGLGMLLGGLLVAAMAPRRLVLWVLLGFACSCLAVAITALVPKGIFGAAVAWWFISGLTFVFGSAPLMALLQSVVPLHVQGRALSLLNAVMGLAGPVGLAFIAPLGNQVAINALFVAIGVAGAAVRLMGLLSRPLLCLSAEEG